MRDVTEYKKIEQTLYESEQRFRMVISNLPIVLFALDRNGVFTLSEGRGLQVLGLQPEQVVGLSVFDVSQDYPEIVNYTRRALAGEAFTFTTTIGDIVFETQYTPLYDEERQLNGVIGLATDVSARVQAEQALQTRERRFRTLIEHSSDMVLVLDDTGICRYASPSHQRILGYAPEELVGVSVFNFLPPEDWQQALTAFANAYCVDETKRQFCRLRHANGSLVTLEYTVHNCLDDPAIHGFVINARDVTEQVVMEDILRHQASHDALTDLPNRALLVERLEQAIEATEHAIKHTEGAMSGVALLMMDLDRFKEINDTFGHHHGDVLLRQVGERLCQVMSDSATVARLGGDEFAVLLPIAGEKSVQQVASALHAALEEPFTIGEISLQIQASIGVALYPEHGADAVTLLRRADVAMYTAKQAHQGYALYDAAQDTYSPRRLALVGALRQAIANNELKLYYQPKVELQTGEVHSVEALVRWPHPEYGFIPPDQFIPLAEQTGLIVPLSLWVLETAIRQCREWLEAGRELSVAVNLSMWDLHEVTLPNTIAALLERYSVPSHLLCVELTESAVMTDIERTLDILTRLSSLGVHITVDDFGTGYSSLAYLKRLPITELKIDRSFVQHMSNVEVDATIVQSTVTMAHSLGLQVVAEGVEDKETLQLLADFRCDIAQGYYMSRPVSSQDLENWLSKANAA